MGRSLVPGGSSTEIHGFQGPSEHSDRRQEVSLQREAGPLGRRLATLHPSITHPLPSKRAAPAHHQVGKEAASENRLRARGAVRRPVRAWPDACEPAWVLARGAMRLRRCVRPNAFGNVLGESLAGAMGQSARTVGGSALPATAMEIGPGLNDNDWAPDDTYQQDRIAQLRTQASSSSSDYYSGARAGLTAMSPVEVQQAGASGSGGYLPSMFPDSQLVNSWRGGNGITHNEWDTGADATSTRLPSISVASLPPASTMVSMGPERNFLMEGIAAARADTVGYYNDMIANSDSFLGKAAGVGGRIFANAGYDFAGAAGGLYTLATDANARAQLGERAAYAATHPMNTIYAASKGAESYVTNTSLGQILEDGARLGVGGLAFAGAGKVATSVGGLALDGTAATGRWLAPKLGEVAEGYVGRFGTAYAVESGPSLGGAAAGNVESSAARSAYQYELLKRDLLRQEIANPGESMSGPVVFRDPVAGATPAQVQQIRQYTALGNLAIDEGYMSPTGRISTTGATRNQASYAADVERGVAIAEGRPYAGVVGHGPDTTWTGRPVSPFWLDMDRPINSSLGRQAQNYLPGYKPTRFIYEGDLNWTGNGNW